MMTRRMLRIHFFTSEPYALRGVRVDDTVAFEVASNGTEFGLFSAARFMKPVVSIFPSMEKLGPRRPDPLVAGFEILDAAHTIPQIRLISSSNYRNGVLPLLLALMTQESPSGKP